MNLKEILGSQFKGYSIHDIIKHFIVGDVVFTNSAYDEPYELLDKCWDNKSGEDIYNTLLSYYVELTLNDDLGEYGIYHLQNPYVGESAEELSQGKMRALEEGYKEISFEEFQTSRFWK